MTDTTSDNTYVAEDADGTPCLWLQTPGSGMNELLVSKDDVRIALNAHKPNASWGAPSRDVYVDRLWDAIAATAGEAPKDDDEDVTAEEFDRRRNEQVPDSYREYLANLDEDAREPTPEQVEADLAQDEQAHARYYATEALVAEFAPRFDTETTAQDAALLREFATAVLEVGGQQPGVPVEKVREVVDFLRDWAKGGEARLAASTYAYNRSADYMAKVLLPKEPTS